MCIITGLFKKLLAPDKQINYEDDIPLLFIGSLQKKMQAASKDGFPQGSL